MITLSITTYVVICAVFFIAGIIDAISGGGGLLTLPTMLIMGIPPHVLAGTNQMSALPGGIVALYKFIRNGKIYWLTALLTVPFTILGSFLGTELNLILDEKYLQMIMVILIPIVSIIVFLNRNFGMENHVEELSTGHKIVSSMIIGIFMGGYVGFYGAGGGTFFLLGFAILNKLDLITATANAKVCGVAATLTAAITYAVSGQVIWTMAVAAAAFNIIGNYIGASLAINKGAQIVRKMFMVVMALLFIRLVMTLFFS